MQDRSTRSTDTHSNGGSDEVRRDALARSLCARICDERRGVDLLEALDHVLAYLEREADGEEIPSLLFQLHRDRFNENEGDELDRAHRRSWNAAMKHATGIVRAHLAVPEMQSRELAEVPQRPSPTLAECKANFEKTYGTGAPFDEPPVEPLPPPPVVRGAHALMDFDNGDLDEETKP